MDKTEFFLKLEGELQRQILEPVQIRQHKIRKNNGKTVLCLTILAKGQKASPAIPLEPYFQRWRQGCPLECLAEEVLEAWRQALGFSGWEGEDFFCYERVKDRIFQMVISREQNREILEEQPWRPFLDLAVVCYCRLDPRMTPEALVRIDRRHLERWGIGEEELFRQAKENGRRFMPGRLYSMREILGFQDGEIPLYVLTNEQRYLGAEAITDEMALKKTGERLNSDFFVLPSSIHECLILPMSGQFSREMLRKLVQEVNLTQVEEEEVLSDQVYVYKREQGVLSL